MDSNTKKYDLKNSRALLTCFASTFYYEWKINPGSSDYNMVFDQTLTGDVDLVKLDESIIKLISSHYIYNCHVIKDGSQLYWKPNEQIFGLDKYLINDNLTISNFISKPFSLDKGPLYRFGIVKIEENKFRFIVVLHHILIDGAAANKFLDILSCFYNDQHIDIPSIDDQISQLNDLAQNLEVHNKDSDGDKRAFWNEYLSDINPIQSDFLKKIYIPTKNNQANVSFELSDYFDVGFVRFEFEAELTVSIKQFCKKHKLTPYLLSKLMYSILIYKYTAIKKFGIPFPMEIREGRDLFFGAHVNTAIISYNYYGCKSVLDLMEAIRSSIKAIKNNKSNYLPIYKVLHKKESTILNFFFSQTNIKRHLFAFKNIVADINYDTDIDLFGDLIFELDPSQSNLSFCVKYKKSLICQYKLNRFIDAYKNLFVSILGFNQVKPSEIKVLDLELLNSKDKKELLFQSNQLINTNRHDLLSLFRARVESSPSSVALVSCGVEVSYEELDKRSTQLAYYLREVHGVGLGDRVVLCLDRGIDQVLGILGVLRAGGCYVPVEPGYPDERIGYVVSDSSSQLVLCNESHIERLSDLLNAGAASLMVLDSSLDELLCGYSETGLVESLGPEDLCYVIYTSGTTGHPKGVMQSHGNVCRLFESSKSHFDFGPEDVWTMFHSYVFDFSVWELWGALLHGGTLVLPSYEESRDFDMYRKLCIAHGVTVLNQTPSAFYQLMLVLLEGEVSLETLRYVIFGGEALNVQQLSPWFSRYGDARPILVNMYGITETTVHVTYQRLHTDMGYSTSIGKRLCDLSTYVLDDCLHPVPVGAIGELYVGGAGLSPGYLNNESLTQERFIENPYQSALDKELNRNSRLYRTGDIVRWLEDGSLSYVGRRDFQVKLRGYRIELGEIEYALSSCEGVEQSCVLLHEGQGQSYLVGYYVSHDKSLSEEVLIRYLSKRLPSHMVPSVLLSIPTLPLTINGKLDREALPSPELFSEEGIVGARTEVESTLIELWSEVLNLPTSSIGVTDNFFRLGGDSLLAIRLVGLLKEHFSRAVSVRDIFTLKTVSELAELLSTSVSSEGEQGRSYAPYSLVPYGPRPGIVDCYPASYLQKGMLLETQLQGNQTYENVLYFEFDKSFDESRFVSVWAHLVSRHELLRASFSYDDERGFDVLIHESISLDYRVYRDCSVEALVSEVQGQGFDYERAGLFRLVVNDLGGRFHLIFASHHAIEDGWSVASLINEFIQSYVDGERREPLDCHYGEFVGAEQKALSDEGSIGYWREYLSGYEPYRFSWGFGSSDKSDSLLESSYALEASMVSKVHALSEETGVGLDNIFLLAYLETLSYLLNQDDITIGVVTHNRLECRGGDELFGLFLNTLPLRYKRAEWLDAKALERLYTDRLTQKAHQRVPYGYIKSLVGEKLYEFAFNYTHFHVINESSHHLKAFNSFERTNIPFLMHVHQVVGADFSIVLQSNSAQLDKRYLAYFMSYYKKALVNIVDKLNDSLALLPEDKQLLLEDWNVSESSYPKGSTLVDLFEDQVSKTPDHIALVYGTEQLSYGELNARSNQLARHLRETLTIAKDSRIGLCLDRSTEMLVGMLGILKAGGSYVPIDPNYPDDRFRYMVSDAGCLAVLSMGSHVARTEDLCGEVPVYDLSGLSEELKDYSKEDLGLSLSSSSLAYVMYTSGTTGQPKGVMVEHKSVVNTIYAIFSVYDFTNNNKVTAFTNYVFDVSVSEFFVPLLQGGELHILREETKQDVDAISDYLIDNEIGYVYLPPALLAQLPHRSYPALEGIIYAGEPCEPSVAGYWSRHYRLYNYYGPTEATIYATGKQLISDETHIIGSPIANTTAYVLDKSLRVLPLGAVGELYLGGDGLARGYLNQAELTAACFIKNPYQSDSDKQFNRNSRLYRTGDLARWLPSSELEYLGRADTQIKLRGYRIELEEIEQVISSYPGVSQSAVLLKTPADRMSYLVGYYVREQSSDDSESTRLVESWDEVFQSIYSQMDQSVYRANFSGWKSSYTGEAIASDAMEEWLSCTLSRIRGLSPKVVLELGSGSGMLLFNLIDECEHYYANDISAHAVEYVDGVSAQHGYATKVTTFVGPADSVDLLKLKHTCDTVLLNSVVQYFPSLDYMTELLSKLLSQMNGSSQIFIGDVRDNRLLNCFHYDILSHQSGSVTRAEVAYHASRDKELLISPAYFYALKQRFPSISDVTVMPRRGSFDTEMNRYRYDVILHINQGATDLTVSESDFVETLSLSESVDSNQGKQHFGIRYPNARIAGVYSRTRELYQQAGSLKAETLSQLLSMEAIEALGLDQGYQVNFYLNPKQPMYLDILFSREEVSVGYEFITHGRVRGFSNDPLAASMVLDQKHNQALRCYLSEKLPDYMVPSMLMSLSHLPLTANGKLDRRALPEVRFEGGDEYVGPRNELDKSLLSLWSELLGLPETDFGIRDDFFRLGGDSIISIQLVSRIRQRLNRVISVKEIFESKTIERLSDLLSASSQSVTGLLTEQGTLTGGVPLLPIQRWFFDSEFEQESHWNQSFMISVPPLSKERLLSSLSALVSYHDAFRLRYFRSADGVVEQYYDASLVFDSDAVRFLDVGDLEHSEGSEGFAAALSAELTRWQSDFDIENGPSYCFGYLSRYSDGSCRIFVSAHHLLIDVVSWRILLSDLSTLYSGRQLGEKGSSYRQWGERLLSYKEQLWEERTYWEELSTAEDGLVEHVGDGSLSHHVIELSESETASLLTESHVAYYTKPLDLLLSALGYGLRELTGEQSQVVLLEGHGRESLSEDLDISRTVGWFTTMYPVCLSLSDSVGESIVSVKESLRGVPHNGLGYGVLFGYEPSNLPSVVFNYLGQLSQTESSGGNDWQIVGEGSGYSIHPSNISRSLLSLNGGVLDGRLWFQVESRLSEPSTKHFLKLFKSSIVKVLSETLSQSRSYLTSSDINSVVSADCLSRIQSEREVDGVYLANSLQQGFIYHYLNQGTEDDAYIVQLLWRYHSSIDNDKLLRAWEAVTSHYSALRLRFDWSEQLVQVIDREGSVDFRRLDISDGSESIESIQKSDRLERYDLSSGRLFRVYLLKEGSSRYSCLLSNHHSILDGWSMPVLLNAVHGYYVSLLEGVEPSIGLLGPDSYGLAQRYLQQHAKSHDSYWHDYVGQLDGELDLSGLLKDKRVRLSSHRQVLSPHEQGFEIVGDLYRELKGLSHRAGVTLSSILQYAWHKTLSIYSHSEQTVSGMIVSGRGLPVDGIESSVGLYINTLPLILSHGRESIIEALQGVHAQISEINARSQVSLSKLQRDGERLFDSLFIFENYPMPEENVRTSLNVEYLAVKEKLDYPIAMIVYDFAKKAGLRLMYDKSIIDCESVKLFLESYKAILTQITALPEQSVSKLNGVDYKHYLYVTEEWNDTQAAYINDKTIHERINIQALKTPNNTAVYDQGLNETFTYKQLVEDFKKVFIFITGVISPYELLLGVLSEKGYNQVVSTVGILSTGKSFVPLNIDWPNDRIISVLKQAEIKTLLISKQQSNKLDLIEKLAKNSIKTLVIENTIAQAAKSISKVQLSHSTADANNIAYVIYTSGSTGQPKGVTISHKGAINTILAVNERFNFSENDRTIVISDLSFDLAIYDIFGPLFVGAKVIFPTEKNAKNPDQIISLIQSEKVTIWNTVPQLASLLIESYESQSITNSHLRVFLLSGDWIPLSLPNRIRRICHNAEIYSLGGATEGSIWSIWYKIDKVSPNWASVPYGNPMPNQKVFILDKNQHLTPCNVPGEIYIGGDGVALDYWNNPEQTRKSFFEHEKLGKIYRTGDLGRLSSKGYIEFLGRVDFQVKLNGYRIELGEIESAILKQANIEQAIALVQEDFNLIVAYFVAKSDIAVDSLELQLTDILPSYMIPKAFIQLDKLPLTANGKLNRGMIPKFAPNLTQKTIEPDNEIERIIKEVWCDLLSLDYSQSSVNDQFFQQGGNSILAIRLISSINRKIDTTLNPSIMFRVDTIRKLAEEVKSDLLSIDKQELEITPNKYEKDTNIPLSFAQERLWFIEQYEDGTNAYNIPLIFELVEDINIQRFCECLKTIVDRHSILRTIIRKDNENTPYQKVLDSKNLSINQITLSCLKDLQNEINNTVSYTFNLESEIPIKVNMVTVEESAIHRIFCVILIHHIAFDGWSSGIFLKELLALYSSDFENNTLIDALPKLPIQYRDFSTWQKNYLSRTRYTEQLSYWKNKLAGYEEIKLPTKARSKNISYLGGNLEFILERSVSDKLRRIAKEENISLYTVLLSGFFILLMKYCKQNDIVVGTPIANRHYNKVEDLIGFFVNTLALRLIIDEEQSILSFIQALSKELIEAQLHQDLPFEKLVDELKIPKNTSKHPVFQVMFAMQNFSSGFDQSIDNELENNIFKVNKDFEDVYNVAKFDLCVYLNDTSEQLGGYFNYSTRIVYTEIVECLIDLYKNILCQIADIKDFEKVDLPISDIVLKTDSAQKINNNFDKATTVLESKSLTDIFEAQVEKSRDHIALVYGTEQLSYGELNARSNQLARHLRETLTIAKDSRIGLCLDRSTEMLVGILGILKAGGSYVPIDPNYPDDRFRYMVSDAGCLAVLSMGSHVARTEDLCGEVPVYDLSGLSEELKDYSKEDLGLSLSSSSLAYVMYTSGTTGQPKGVMVEQGNVVSLATADYVQLSEQDTTIHLSDIAFDASTFELWSSLLNGSRVLIPEDRSNLLSDVSNLSSLLESSGVSVMWLTKSLFDQLYSLDETLFSGLRYLLIGGEALNKSLVSHLVRSEYRPAHIINGYGPTENTTFSCVLDIKESDLLSCDSIPIGSPISNRTAYVLDTNLKLLPVGAIGELYVGGSGVSRGYLNNEALTAERFIENPYQSASDKDLNRNGRLYRTGDIVRWLPCGSLEYLGRLDSQVKVRGYRIELEEIERAILSYPGVSQSAVTVKDLHSNQPKIIAYYIKDEDAALDDEKNILNDWDTTFQALYENLDINQFKTNFEGWNSSYTDKPIPHKAMLDWLERTLERIIDLDPKHILEIGSGTGLMLFNLLEKCDSYYATDIASHSIDYLDEVLENLDEDYKKKVQTFVYSANDFKLNDKDITYDTVIINSVAQYFPDIDYMTSLLENLISNIDEKGNIFIGDIRDFRLLKCFHHDILRYKHAVVDNELVDYHSIRENELLISPIYFYNLSSKIPYISNIKIMSKLGDADTEMHEYRYDVVLAINKQEDNCQKINQYDIIKTNDIDSTIRSNLDKDYMAINYPNSRIYKRYHTFLGNYNSKKGQITSNTQFHSLMNICEISDKYGYTADFRIDINDPAKLVILLAKPDVVVNYNPEIRMKEMELANTPIRNSLTYDNELSSQLKTYLKGKLPEFMIPDFYVAMNHFPVTANGKLDRANLPDIQLYHSKHYKAPRSDVEAQLAKIWGDVLGIPSVQIGIRDNFFDMGGNSILSTKLITKINASLNSNIKISDLFTSPTIEKLMPKLFMKKQKYHPVIKLNREEKKPTMFMIHPGHGGCEAYFSIADKFKEHYYCLGIDSFNLYHKKKLKKLDSLAQFYLKYIEEHLLLKTNQSEINLFGWSLGGIISLEIASQLEQMGYRNINIYLLDVFLSDQIDMEKLQPDQKKIKAHRLFLQSQGYDESYVDKILENIPVENILSNSKISCVLKHSSILLFKAMRKSPTIYHDKTSEKEIDAFHKHQLSLEKNNIDRVVNDANHVSVVKMHDAHHGNVLDFEDFILERILIRKEHQYNKLNNHAKVYL